MLERIALRKYIEVSDRMHLIKGVGRSNRPLFVGLSVDGFRVRHPKDSKMPLEIALEIDMDDIEK